MLNSALVRAYRAQRALGHPAWAALAYARFDMDLAHVAF